MMINNECGHFGLSSRAVIYLCLKRMIKGVFWVLQSALHGVVDF
jgi:hypothetical protein